MDLKQLLEKRFHAGVSHTGKIPTYAQQIPLSKKHTPESPLISLPSYDLVMCSGWVTHTSLERFYLFATLNAPQVYYSSMLITDGTLSDLHSHQHIELTYVAKGSLSIVVENQTLHVSEGEFILINSDVTHGEYLYGDESSILCFGLDDLFFDDYMNENGNSAPSNYNKNLRALLNEKRSEYKYILFQPKNDFHDTNRILTLLFDELTAHRVGRKYLILGAVERLVDLLTLEFHMSITTSDKAAFTNAIVADLKQYIKDNYATVTATELGSHFHYSPDYVNRIFKSIEGITLSKYIQEIRLQQAMLMIANTDLSITDIITTVGYNNQGFFYKKFKERFGKLPMDIKRI